MKLHSRKNRSMEPITTANGESSKSLKSRIVFFVVCLLFPMAMLAQINFAEEQKKEEGWEYLRNAMMMPFDSTDFNFRQFPIAEAYRKYIGQQIFFLDNPSREDWKNKYFEIIDVIPECDGRDYYSYPCKDKPNELCSSNGFCRITYKIKNIQTSEIFEWEVGWRDHLKIEKDWEKPISKPVYDNRNKYILVGSFVKFKEAMVGKNMVYINEGPCGFREPYHKYNVKTVWKCTDVSIAANADNFILNDRCGYFKEAQVVFVLQDTKNPSIVKHAPIGVFLSTVAEFENAEECCILEKTFQDYNNRNKQAEIQYKQQLTTKYGAAAAEKILARKLEIGMSKAVCNEIVKGAYDITTQSATTEIWRIKKGLESWYGGCSMLHFTNGKLDSIIK